MPNPTVRMVTTQGEMRIEIFEDRAPKTAANFLKLTRNGFYNGLLFHRVIPGFMIQGGDPRGDGTGGPGYNVADEFVPGLKHEGPGILSMANTGRQNTGGSQFFITLAATPWLDGKHAVFGRVIEGKDVPERIAGLPVDGNDRPRTAVKMTQVTVE